MRLAVLLLTSLTLFAQARRDRHVVIISIDGLAAYAFNDRSIPLPNLRRLASEGAAAEAMTVVNPAVTWPNHTSMVTGVTPARHTVIYNGLAQRGSGGVPVKVEPWVDKTELVKVPTLYDVAHEAGLTTAEVDWVAILNASTISYSFSERPVLDSPIVKEMIAAGQTTEADIRNFSKMNIIFRDEVWTQAGEHIIEKHKPGLLLFHLLTTDSAQHRYGARSLGGNTAIALADARVGRLLESIRKAGIADSTTVFIVSDHGFKTFTNSIRPNALLRSKGLVRGDDKNIECDAWVIPEGGTAMVYITRPERRTELIPQLKTAFSAVRGISAVLGPEKFDRLGYPDPAKNNRMADLVLAADDGYGFSGDSTGEVTSRLAEGMAPGTHGYLSSNADMDAVFIASGAGIRPGTKLGRIRNLDVGPTAARLLGLELKNVQGRVLTEILK